MIVGKKEQINNILEKWEQVQTSSSRLALVYSTEEYSTVVKDITLYESGLHALTGPVNEESSQIKIFSFDEKLSDFDSRFKVVHMLKPAPLTFNGRTGKLYDGTEVELDRFVATCDNKLALIQRLWNDTNLDELPDFRAGMTRQATEGIYYLNEAAKEASELLLSQDNKFSVYISYEPFPTVVLEIPMFTKPIFRSGMDIVHTPAFVEVEDAARSIVKGMYGD